MNERIPKVIHYCWFGNNELPLDVKGCINSWKKYCPDYKIIRWDESNFDVKMFKYTQQAYSEKKWAFVSDVARLYIIYKNGGVYLDTDVELIKPLDDLLDNECFMGFEQGNSVATGLGFGAKPNNEIIYKNLQLYINLSFYNVDGSLNLKPCPEYTTELLIKYGLKPNGKTQKFNNIKVYSVDYFCPRLLTNGGANTNSFTYSIHHYAGSWISVYDKNKQAYRVEIYTKYGKFGLKIIDGIFLFKENGFFYFIKRLFSFKWLK